MLLDKESTLKIFIQNGCLNIGNQSYAQPTIITLKGIEPYREDGQSLSSWFIGKPRSGQIFLLISDSEFHREYYDRWASWAHQSGVGFDKMHLKGFCQILPFLKKELRDFRALVLSQYDDDRNIWPPAQ
jgi:hypothetical protein